MGTTIMRNCDGVVVLDKPKVIDSSDLTIYAFLYNDKVDDFVAITDEELLDQFSKVLKKKLGKCGNIRRINVDGIGANVLSFDEFIKENYPIQNELEYEHSDIHREIMQDMEEEEEE